MIEGFLLNGIASVATVFLTAAYVPQIAQTFRTKNVDGISIQFWLILNVALTLLLINAAVVFATTGVWGYLVTEILNEGLAFVMLVMVVKYRKKEAVK